MTTIYALCDPVTRFPRYVGQSIDYAYRFTKHRAAAKRGDGEPVYVWWRSLGSDPLLEVLEPATDIEAERFWIEYLTFLGCDLLNADSGGRTLRSDETILKIRAAVNRPEVRAKILGGSKMRGKNHSAETKRRMSAAHKGRKLNLSPESRQRRRASRLGKTLSAESREKIAVARRGRPLSAEHRQKISAAGTGRKATAETIAKRTATLNRPELKEQMRQARIGLRRSPESKARMSEARRAWWARKRGEVN